MAGYIHIWNPLFSRITFYGNIAVLLTMHRRQLENVYVKMMKSGMLSCDSLILLFLTARDMPDYNVFIAQ